MKRTVAWVSAVVVFAVVAAVVIALIIRTAVAVEVAPEPPVAQVAAPLVGLGDVAGDAGGDDAQAPAPLPDGYAGQVQSIMSAAAAKPEMGNTFGVVTDVATGQVLWERGATTAATPASSTKVLTAAAALVTLDPESRLATRVLAGPQPGTVILQGTGDEILSADGDGAYGQQASMADLAAQVKDALGGQAPETVYVDLSASADPFHPTWEREGIAEGYIAPISPVGIDGGRLNPGAETRGPNPALAAGQVLAGQLGGGDVVDLQQAPAADADVLGEVRSAPLIVRVHQMLIHSDNVLAEHIGREVAAARGLPRTFAGAAEAVTGALADHGLLLDGGAQLADTSGLSPDNRIEPAQLDRVLRAAAGDEEVLDAEYAAEMEPADITAALSHFIDGLPVAGVSGTLATRYPGNPGAGWVRAKTGTLDKVAALSGVVSTDGGRLLTFTLLNNDCEVAGARAAADAAMGQVRQL